VPWIPCLQIEIYSSYIHSWKALNTLHKIRVSPRQ
jgi:hypothetical protein